MTFSRTVLVGVELRLLLEIADAGALGDPGLAVIFLVEAGHDPQQRRLAGAVDAEHADLGVGVERQMDVIEHLPGRVALGQTLHEIDELASHRDPLKPVDLRKFAAADVAARPPKGNRGNPFSIRSPRMNTGWTPCVPQIRQLKPSFNKSGENSFSAPKKASHAAKAASENSRPRHGYDQFGIPSPPRRTAAPDWQSRSQNSAPSGASSSPRRSTPTGRNCTICAARARPGAPSISAVRTELPGYFGRSLDA